VSGSIVYRKGTLLILTGPVDHLHIVMNDPVYFPESGVEAVLLVNVTSVRGAHDDACVLSPGCHPFVRYQSFVSYRHAAIVSAVKLSNEIANGDISTDSPVDEELFGSIRAGFEKSKFVTPKVRRFLKNYVDG
jgi:hypothetical protein